MIFDFDRLDFVRFGQIRNIFWTRQILYDDYRTSSPVEIDFHSRGG
jgi:hypothetical protein